MKKKLMALISALVLCVGLMVPVSAADQTFTDVLSGCKALLSQLMQEM